MSQRVGANAPPDDKLSEIEPGEGFVSVSKDPHPPSTLRVSGTLSRKGRG
jgi:hypothetical protein